MTKATLAGTLKVKANAAGRARFWSLVCLREEANSMSLSSRMRYIIRCFRSFGRQSNQIALSIRMAFQAMTCWIYPCSVITASITQRGSLKRGTISTELRTSGTTRSVICDSSTAHRESISISSSRNVRGASITG